MFFYFPIPETVIAGLLEALLIMIIALLTVPAAVGAKVTLRLQVFPDAIGAAQVPNVAVNGALVVTDVITRLPGPRLVTFIDLLRVVPIRRVPKSVFAGTVMVGPGTTPVPLRVTLDGDPAAL